MRFWPNWFGAARRRAVKLSSRVSSIGTLTASPLAELLNCPSHQASSRTVRMASLSKILNGRRACIRNGSGWFLPPIFWTARGLASLRWRREC